jgi:hypothetical protein
METKGNESGRAIGCLKMTKNSTHEHRKTNAFVLKFARKSATDLKQSRIMIKNYKSKHRTYILGFMQSKLHIFVSFIH